MHNILIRKSIFSLWKYFYFQTFLFCFLLFLHSVNSLTISNRFVYSAKTTLFKSDIENFHGANPDGAAVSKRRYFRSQAINHTQYIRLTFTSHSHSKILFCMQTREKSLSGKIERRKIPVLASICFCFFWKSKRFILIDNNQQCPTKKTKNPTKIQQI